MGGRTWKKEEDDLLRKLWNTPGALKCHLDEFQDRSIESVLYRGRAVLGLKNRSKIGHSNYSWIRDLVDKEFQNGFIGTKFDLSVLIGASHNQVGRLVEEGHGEKYYISGWMQRANNGDYKAIWAYGSSPDVKKPARKSTAENSRKYRMKKRMLEGRINPFAGMISQVTTGEKISMKPSKGSYGSRVHYMDEAA